MCDVQRGSSSQSSKRGSKRGIDDISSSSTISSGFKLHEKRLLSTLISKSQSNDNEIIGIFTSYYAPIPKKQRLFSLDINEDKSSSLFFPVTECHHLPLSTIYYDTNMDIFKEAIDCHTASYDSEDRFTSGRTVIPSIPFVLESTNKIPLDISLRRHSSLEYSSPPMSII
mmetsp:Transcript_4006/g.4096  ORF Transcript_4006/g.4096 Transcript_4006/m.4096 type:complete len:170 (-) Transcript_4006:189-698(-)